MIILNQTSKVSDGVTASFTIPADKAIQVAYDLWNQMKGAQPSLAFTFASPDLANHLDGQFAIWLQRFENNQWVGNGGVMSDARDIVMQRDGRCTLIVPWDGQDLISRMTVVSTYPCTITSMSYQIIYP